MRAAHLAIVLAVFVYARSSAAELIPRVTNPAFGASIVGLPFPATLTRDLTSGFENRIFIRISVVSSGKVIVRRDAVITAKYDLWEEQFTVQKFVGDALVAKMTFKQAQEVLAYLGRVELDDLFAVDSVQQGQDIAMQAEVSINPVEREKIERVRKWVAGNSMPGAVGADPAGAPLIAKPNDLFNKIFDQYTRGEDIVATWKMTVISKVFNRHTRTEAIVK